MHIHSSQMHLNTINPYADAADKAIAAQRSANVRKRLKKAATEIDSLSGSDEESIVSQWAEQSGKVGSSTRSRSRADDY